MCPEIARLDFDIRLFGPNLRSLSEAATEPFIPAQIREIGNIAVAFEDGVDSETQGRIESLLGTAHEKMSWLVGSPDNRLTVVLVTSRQGVYGLVARMKNEVFRIVLWRPEFSDAMNLWHFAHECTEIAVLTLGRRLDRWLVEGLAQLAAYHVTKSLYPQEVVSVCETYRERGVAPVTEVFAWKTPPGQYLTQQNVDTQTLVDDLLRFIAVDHQKEKPLYGAVLDLMLRWTREEDDAVRKILKSATESKGLNAVQIVESAYGTMESLSRA